MTEEGKMPEEYLKAITGILTQYDGRQKRRAQNMQKKILIEKSLSPIFSVNSP